MRTNISEDNNGQYEVCKPTRNACTYAAVRFQFKIKSASNIFGSESHLSGKKGINSSERFIRRRLWKHVPKRPIRDSKSLFSSISVAAERFSILLHLLQCN